LLAERDIEVVAEASDGQAAVDLVRSLQPDVVTMDVSMPGMDGVEATRLIHAEFPQVSVIGLSMFEESERAQAMRDAGAVTYLTKSGPPTALVSAIRACVKTGLARAGQERVQ
jgi:DNA-binding NarL/FixJ family response regulator